LKTKWQLIYSFIKSNSLLVSIAFLSGLLFNFLTLLIPVSLGYFYEFNFEISSKRLKLLEFIPFIKVESFTVFLMSFLGLIFIRFIFEFINRYAISIIGERFAKNLREQLFEHQLNINTIIYDQKGIGKYLLRYSGDLKSIQNYVTRGLFRFAQDLFLIVFILIAIAYINLYFSFIVTIAISVTAIIVFFINNFLYTISINRRNQRAAMLTFVNTRLRAIPAIKVFNKHTPEEKRYAKRSKNLYAVGKKYQQVISFIQSIIPMLTYLILALLMAYIYYLKVTKGAVFNTTILLILILLIISFLPILRRTLRVGIVWKLGNISFEKLLHLFYLEAENTIPFKNVKFSKNKLHFKNVSFTYSALKNTVFKNINLTIHPKNTTLIIGNSGIGKNTFVKLILKIYQPTNGSILFGKNSYNELAEKTIRKNITVISDAFPLYGKTVYEAIVYSRNKKRENNALALLKKLQQFESDSNKLELQDYIGDMGNTLTSGQKKILLYCRALLTNKPWILIDQPFKDLNSKTITHFKNILNTLKGTKTIIILDTKTPKGLNVNHIYTIKNGTFIKKV